MTHRRFQLASLDDGEIEHVQTVNHLELHPGLTKLSHRSPRAVRRRRLVLGRAPLVQFIHPGVLALLPVVIIVVALVVGV